jgi:hypothetical protein
MSARDSGRGAPARAALLAALGTALGVALPIAAAPAGAAAQGLAERVARVEGVARLSFATRPDVCGDGAGTIGYGDGRRTIRRTGSVRSHGEWEPDGCVPGPARVSLTVRGGEVTRMRLYVGGRWRAGGDSATDLGMVAAPAAADFLLSLAERGDGPPAGEAVLAATLADSAVVWPRLLRLARDDGRPRATRREAAFWLAEAAADRNTGTARASRDEDSPDVEVRKQAVFALSQRPRDESVPALTRIARTNRDPDVRRAALFWLGQSGDDRALDLFEELLRER